MNAEELYQIKETAVAEVRAAGDAKALEELRIKYLSRNGLLQDLMGRLQEVPREEKPAVGKALNVLKNELQELVKSRQEAFADAGKPAAEATFDFTLPGNWRGAGTHHPITSITDRATDIFRSIGFTVAEGPDIETAYYNFDALNTPEAHPSRDSQDTFYLSNGELLRTQTSPVQIRYMEKHRPPIRIIAPGRCYRRDTPDATHSANFHQIEGLYVSKNVSLSDLKGDLTYFAQQILGPETRVRFRPHFFPFTEPSVEFDFSCHLCRGQGCRVCKNSGWIEIAGAGMVDPNVLEAVHYDPDVYSGYAFGLGIERIAMIKYGITDIRLLYENDVRFLRQF